MAKRNKSGKHKVDKVELPEFDHRAYLNAKYAKKEVSNTSSDRFSLFLICGIIIIGIIVGTGVFSPNQQVTTTDTRSYDIENIDTINNGQLLQVTVYSTPSCGCCHQFVDYIERNGFEVTFIKDTDKLELMKQQLGIPDELISCHTLTYGSLFVEGHVPAQTIVDFLGDNQGYDGISLPNMPAGSPGMSGDKDGDWVISAILDGVNVRIYVTI